MILDEEKNENICLVKKYTIKRGKNLFGICKNKKQKEGEMKKIKLYESDQDKK